MVIPPPLPVAKTEISPSVSSPQASPEAKEDFPMSLMALSVVSAEVIRMAFCA